MRTRIFCRIISLLAILGPLLFGKQVPLNATWERASVSDPQNRIDLHKFSFNRIVVLPSGNGWAIGSTADSLGQFPIHAIARSQDGGQSWRFLPVLSRSKHMINSIFFLDADRGWAAVTKIQQSKMRAYDVLLHSRDGGKSWEEWSSLEALDAGLTDIAFKMDGAGIAVGIERRGEAGLVLRTTNFGKTWSVETRTPSVIQRIVVRNNRNWALSDDRILSGQSGRNWRTVYEKRSFLFGIDTPSEMSVVAACHAGGLVRSVDGGQSWESITLPAPYEELYLGPVKFADAHHGWVTGHKGVILATNDGGGTWTFESQLESNFLMDLAVSATKVFAVGQDGAIYWRLRP